MKEKLLLAVLSASVLLAQSTGRITGSVVDPSGSAVPGATIQLLLQDGSKPVAATVSSPQGLFTLEALRPVVYVLTVAAAGFQTAKVDGVKVDPARATDLPEIRLQLASATTSIDVTAGVETVQVSSTEISTTVTAAQLDRLPVGDRNPLAFISTQAGVAPSQFETSINGQRSSFSNVTLDGINIQDNYIRTGGLDYTPSQLTLDQVQEFTVTSSNQSSVDDGGASQVNFVTLSGGNNLHGSVYWQNRNSALAANSWFNNQDRISLPVLNLNQTGVSVTGPIIRDKLFFSAVYGLYRLRNQTTNNATVLTSDARQGIFSYVDSRGALQKANILRITGLAPDPVMSALLAQVPGPEKINNFRVGDSTQSRSLNTAGYSFLVRNNRDKDNVQGRLDYNLSLKHNLSTTFVWNRDTVDRPDEGSGYGTIPFFKNDDARKLLSSAWRFSPRANFTNELRGGFYFAPATFQSSGNLPAYLVGGTSWSSPVAAASADILDQGRSTNTYVIKDTANWINGRHSVRFGYQYSGVRVESYDYTGTIPTYNVGIDSVQQGDNLLFSSDLPRISATDLDNANYLLASLAGLLNDASKTYNVTSRTSGFVDRVPYLRHLEYANHALYVADSWRARKGLTLSGGLRWDYSVPVNERDSLELQPQLVGGDPRKTLLSNASLDFTGNSVGRPFYNKDLNNFAPNVGFAWDVRGNGKTSVRGGYMVAFVNDEAIQVAEAFTAVNPGIQSYLTEYDLGGFMSKNRPALNAPTFKVPLKFSDAYADNSTLYVGMVDPRLRTPYVQQYYFSLEHEFKGTIIQASYVGNHATKLMRGFDFNQTDITSNGFLPDFKRAQQNGNLARAATGVFNPAYNSRIAGSQPLPVFDKLYNRGYLTDPGFRQLIDKGEVAELAAQYQIYGLNGSVDFFPNPNTLAALYMTNFSNTTYNSLQLEARRRLQKGLAYQVNYTYSKALSDASGVDQLRYEPFLDLNNPSLGRARTPVDLRHQFKGNYSYDLPMGNGHWLKFRKAGLNRVLNGWITSGNLYWVSGNPFSIASQRGTFLRESFSGTNEANSSYSGSQITSLMGLRMTPSGPVFFPDSIKGSDGRAVAPDGQAPFAGQIFSNPGPGEVGALQKRMFTGPSVFTMDAAIFKETKLRERLTAQIRIQALNVFNHPTFAVYTQNINSTRFGQVTSGASAPRTVQLDLRLSF